MKLKFAAIAANPKKPQAAKLVPKIASLLKKHGVAKAPAGNLRAKAGHILITVGGDGTILYNKSKFHLPIFAIGSESSFICQARFGNWKAKLGQIIRHGFMVEKRAMLSATLDGKKLPDALNEFVVRTREHRVIRLHLKYGKKSSSFRADGLIFSTATGSRAYAYSAGGKEMPNLSKNYQIVPICPYRREFSPKTVSPATKCNAKIEPYCRADVVSDGQFLYPVDKQSVLKVWVSKKKMEFVKLARKK